MTFSTRQHWQRPLAITLFVSLLAACGSDDSSTPNNTGTSVTGTAATGAAVVGATVSASCKNGQSYNATAVTSANGSYRINGIPADAYPCALKLSGAGLPAGTSALYSIASGSGNSNITPLTSLVLAKAIALAGAGTDLDDWFSNAALASGLQSLVSNHLSDATGVLQSLMSMAGSGYNWPSGGFNPFSTAFTPVAGNAYDDLLEELKRALAAPAATYTTLDALMTALAAGGSVTLPTVPEDEEEPGTDPEAAAGLDLVKIYAGTWTVSGNTRGTVTISADGSSFDFDDGKSFTISGDNVYNRIPNFPAEPRVQIEIPGSPQQRLRIYVDVADNSKAVKFVYYPDADTEAGAIEATVEADEEVAGSHGPIGLASLSAFTDESSLSDTITAVLGSHDVAIYKAPSIAEVGPGKLVVTSSGGNLGFTLQDSDGNTLSSITVPVSDTSCGDGVCVILFDRFTTPLGGRRIGIRDYYADPVKNRIDIGALPNGYLYGSAEGGYFFRNDVLAFGPAVPAVFSTLAGNFSGEHETNFCGRPNLVNVTISSAGIINLQGKSSVNCASQNISPTWDGMDDYIIPFGTAAKLVLDSQNIGGSQTGGGITLEIANTVNASSFSNLYSNFAGANGHITLPSALRE